MSKLPPLRNSYLGPVPTAAQRLDILLEPVQSYPFRNPAARWLWSACLDRLRTARPVLDLGDFPAGLVTLLQTSWIRAHAAMAVDCGVAVHGVRLPPGLGRLPGWLAALPRLQRLELLDCQVSHLDLRGLTGLRQLRVHGNHWLRRVDLPERVSTWIDPGPFHIDVHVHAHGHGEGASTVRCLPARRPLPRTACIHPEPGAGVDERINLNQRIRGPNGRMLLCGDLAALWLNDRMAHHERVRQGELAPETFDYRRLATRQALQARAEEAQVLRSRLRQPGQPVHLVSDSRSGAWLHDRLSRMAVRGQTVSHCWLGSLHHAMALELAIESDAHPQEGPAVPRWVVRLYDPDHTALHITWFAHDRHDLLELRLSQLGHALLPGPQAHVPDVADPLWRLYPLAEGETHEDWLVEDRPLNQHDIGQMFKAGRHDRWQTTLLRQHARRGDLALTLAFLEARDPHGHSLLMRSAMPPPAIQAYAAVLRGLGLQGVPMVFTLLRAFGSETDRPESVLHDLLGGKPARLPLFLQMLRQLPLEPAHLVAVLRPPPRVVSDGWTMPLHEVLAHGRSAVLSAWMLGLRDLLADGRLRPEDVAQILEVRRRQGVYEVCGVALAQARGDTEVLAVWAAGLRKLGLKPADLPGRPGLGRR